jgi:homoserine O-acetyltransferase
MGGISAGRNVIDSAGRENGWWRQIAGPGRPLDPRICRIIGIDFLDGLSEQCPVDDPPLITTDDQAAALFHLCEALGINRFDGIVGASYGGMVALAFAARHPALTGRLLVLCAAHVNHPMSTAWRTIQRDIVRLGISSGKEKEAMAIARALAMTTYRTPEEFEIRFSGDPLKVTDYLSAQGRKYALHTEPLKFLALSRSIDHHKVDTALIKAPVTLVGSSSDRLVPSAAILQLAKKLHGNCRTKILNSSFGHDAFLKETELLDPIVRDFVKDCHDD